MFISDDIVRLNSAEREEILAIMHTIGLEETWKPTTQASINSTRQVPVQIWYGEEEDKKLIQIFGGLANAITSVSDHTLLCPLSNVLTKLGIKKN